MTQSLWTKTTCAYCGVGCGIRVSKIDETHHTASSIVNNDTPPVLINGDKYHPANFGKLCIKGKNLGDTLSNDNRLALPKISNKTQKWPKTLDYVASQGIKRQNFEKMMKSFTVKTKVKKATAITKKSGITGVPAFVINGQYHTSVPMAGGVEELFSVVDFLIGHSSD